MSLPGVAGSHRAVCQRCRRPESVCYCAHIAPLETATRVVLLQHPRERDVPIGTARMASLCLPNSELHVGVHWRGSVALARALSDPARPAALLYPGPGAIDVVANPPRSPVTLVVVDGTWSQTKKVVRENPELAALPRFAFTPPSPSEYRIRKEPDLAYVSTIEALVLVLGALEGDPERFLALLAPFRAMVGAQVAYAEGLHRGRVRRKRAPRPPRLLVPFELGSPEGDLLCVVGEANAWPYSSPERDTAYPDELVHWVARRLGSDESFEAVLAPRNPLSPRTPAHIGLSDAALLAGSALPELLERWRAFVRDTDVVCTWGHYAAALFAHEGGYLPPSRLDLRNVARGHRKGKVGTVEEFSESLGGSSPPDAVAQGRAGVRLAQLMGIARHFWEQSRSARS